METVAVIFGGRSAEHDVSIVTAISTIIKPLELTQKYRVEAVYIAKNGAWYWGDRLKDINLFSSGKIAEFMRNSKPVAVQLDSGLTLVKSGGVAGRKVARKIDIVFPAMHGTYGEDGALMGMLDLAGVPYVGCGVSASAIAMDKVLSKEVAAANDILVSRFVTFTQTDVQDLNSAVRETTKTLHFPLFVKPAHLGSSIGISRAADEMELRNGLEVAAHYDDKIIVEEAVQNLIEITLPIMGPTNNPTPALLEQPLTQTEDFFDFETKYLGQGKKGSGQKADGKQGAQGYSQIPAKIPKNLYAKAEGVGLAAYKAIGCSGLARVDMLIDSKANKVYFNEVNPLPGSLYAHNWRVAGISNVELVQKLIGFAKDRHAERQTLDTTFDTNFLKQF